MNRGISLLTMGSGNTKILRETLRSVSGICNQIVYGDMLLWDYEKGIINSYANEFNLKIVPFNWNYLYQNGFSSLLNKLAEQSDNEYVMYLNTSEVIDIDFGILDAIKNNPECNAFYFTHFTDTHRWFRTYKKSELQWSGILHEQLKGEYIPYHKSIFQMKDLPKDMEDITKAKILDSLKEIVYFKQYMNIIDNPECLGETDPGWVRFSKENYNSFKERLDQRKEQVAAVEAGDLEWFLKTANHDIENQTFKSSIAIEYQNDPAFLDKK
jgi:hypothetical protein